MSDTQISTILDEQKARGKVVLDCIGNGLTLEDALTLAEWTAESFENYKSQNPRFAQLVDRKKVEYKRDLMVPIVSAVRSGDDKMAQWLLERQFHNEFSAKKKPEEQENKSPIANIIFQIQNGTVGKKTIPNNLRKIIKDTQEHPPVTNVLEATTINVSDEE